MSGVAGEECDGGQGELLDVLPAGTVLSGYELKPILGQGAFGITYRARGLTLDRDVAIKEYLPTNLAVRRGRTTVRPRSGAHAEQFARGRERFLEEARTLARLERTPAIVRVYDFLQRAFPGTGQRSVPTRINRSSITAPSLAFSCWICCMPASLLMAVADLAKAAMSSNTVATSHCPVYCPL